MVIKCGKEALVPVLRSGKVWDPFLRPVVVMYYIVLRSPGETWFLYFRLKFLLSLKKLVGI